MLVYRIEIQWFLCLDPVFSDLAELVYSSSYFVDSLGFSKYRITPSADWGALTPSFPRWMPFASSPGLLAWPEAPGRCPSESRRPALFSLRKRDTLTVQVLTGGCSGAFYHGGEFLSTSALLRLFFFKSWMTIRFCEKLFLHLLRLSRSDCPFLC